MSATATVRPARPDEAEAVAALVAAAGLPVDGLDAAWLTLVTEDAGTLAGTATLECHGPPGAPVYLLRSVAVREDLRGKGLGDALVRAGLAAADQDAGTRATVGLLTDTAGGYYGRFGFTAVSRDRLPPALSASPELTTLCPATAASYLRG
jgi:amino-acid N-acetyltransferase